MGLHAGAFRPSGQPIALSDSMKADTAVVDKPNSVVDEVIWVVGDEPILKSEVEIMKLQSEAEGVKWDGDPECILPEQIAVQKLFLHQAAIDSVEVSESEIAQGVDQQINYWISLPQIGSKEKLEQFQNKSMTQIRQDLHDDYKNRLLVQKMQEKLVSDVKVSPAEVREYFKKLPVDSIPMIPTTVEVEILTQTPKVEPEEVNRIKNLLRDYTDRVTKGETSFATLARLYSEDPGSARQGGELGYMGRGVLDPAFAAAAFNLTDPKKVSKVVESEFGYSQENTRTSRFKMKDLPTEVARVVDTMKVGEISVPFQMTNARGKVVCAIVKLKERIPEHRATITEDFQAMRDIVTAKRRKEILHDWVVKKVKETYVRINPRYKSCNFQYEGWLK